jgi:hypothetical protein
MLLHALIAPLVARFLITCNPQGDKNQPRHSINSKDGEQWITLYLLEHHAGKGLKFFRIRNRQKKPNCRSVLPQFGIGLKAE